MKTKIKKFFKKYIRRGKSGRYGMVIRLGTRKIKLYQAGTRRQARFIQRVTGHSNFSDYFPKTVLTVGKIVASDWVEGVSVHTLPHQEKQPALIWLVNFQVGLHTKSTEPTTSEAGFDYVNDFLVKRFKRYTRQTNFPDLDKIISDAVCGNISAESRLSHPDATFKNIIGCQTNSPTFKMIDNEYLTQSPNYLIDLFNTWYSLQKTPDLAAQYLELYARAMPTITLVDGWDVKLSAIWALRLVGTYLQAKRRDDAVLAVQQWAAGEFKNHPVIEMLKRKSYGNL